ncbi:hypothetical protein [Cellvibrio sp. KY-YJ-3]|jgi:hypothetical protein|uniref:hypothetical protein n=1 Tax=Cellvibrio sp. KY-YJ-3 TaxID=454662 RepID=UPI0012487AF6|nr:hypothetical protein [Cellvibrio sp. KY-YJ-3]QEY12430.1 hypothetical protein D0B88_09330 [Cellvibrio sp. KY-YJ-3]
MVMNSFFVDTVLNNRLGQPVSLSVCHLQFQGRDYVMVAAPTQHASSFVGKNAEPFAFQLRERFELDARRFELVEVRETADGLHLYRWRFEWVGNSPLSARSEEIVSPVLRAALLDVIEPAPAAIA